MCSDETMTSRKDHEEITFNSIHAFSEHIHIVWCGDAHPPIVVLRTKECLLYSNGYGIVVQ